MESFNTTFNEIVELSKIKFKNDFKPFKGIDTIAVSGGYKPDELREIGYPVVAPITLSTTFKQLIPGVAKVNFNTL